MRLGYLVSNVLNRATLEVFLCYDTKTGMNVCQDKKEMFLHRNFHLNPQPFEQHFSGNRFHLEGKMKGKREREI